MGNPIYSTYRIQLSPTFTLSDLEGILDYLHDLGVTHIYASPILLARSGSKHGYDTIDFGVVNIDIGGEEAFRRVSRMAHDMGIGWIQDIVPNHMSADTTNRYLEDIFISGKTSRYINMIDLFYRTEEANFKPMLPLLNATYEESLNSGKIRLVAGEQPFLQVEDARIPLSAHSVVELIGGDYNRETAHALFEEINMDPEKIHRILQEQNYQPMYWRHLVQGTNFRRFFTVNSLISLNEQLPETFRIVHEKIIQLANAGHIDGFRVDHVDGLYDPESYLVKLRRESGLDTIYVEKILGKGEELRETWQVSGTTGYDFAFYCNSLFTSGKNKSAILRTYRQFTGNRKSYRNIEEESRRHFLASYFSNEVHYLSQVFYKVLRTKIYGQEVSVKGLEDCIGETLVHMPVYRTYLSGSRIDRKDLTTIETAIKDSVGRIGTSAEQSAIIRLLAEVQNDERALSCFARLQQFMPAVTAKAGEDRAFFIYNPLISLNEVGGNPSVFSISKQEFHRFIRKRASHHRSSMNTLSTHDTKMGEDLRSRICAISGDPIEWSNFIERASAIAAGYRSDANGLSIPSANEEYMIYQLLLADSPERWGNGEFRKRITDHLMKALREAAINTEWNSVNHSYEGSVETFIEGIMTDPHFMKLFSTFYQNIVLRGTLISVSQSVLKMTVPGIPDIYRGSELMNTSFTDPDNRTDADFNLLRSRLSGVRILLESGDLTSILKNKENGDLKLAATYILLNFRREHPDLFQFGRYVRIVESGSAALNLFSFALVYRDQWLIVSLFFDLDGIMGRGYKGPEVEIPPDTVIVVPKDAPEKFMNLFTRKGVENNGRINVRECMGMLPFMVLYSTVSEGT
ncbi:MAG: malto-oligosyltrehalose synthase [Thermoplasmataceae archaeon]